MTYVGLGADSANINSTKQVIHATYVGLISRIFDWTSRPKLRLYRYLAFTNHFPVIQPCYCLHQILNPPTIPDFVCAKLARDSFLDYPILHMDERCILFYMHDH